MPSVAFICTANRCRSVMAHAIFVAEAQRRSLPLETYSAGTFDFRGAPPIHETTTTCEMHQTPAPDDVATFVRDLPLDSIDRFLVMERHHLDALVYEFGVPRERISMLGDFDPQQRGSEIDDPFGHGGPTYTQCYAQIRDCVINYLDTTDEFKK